MAARVIRPVLILLSLFIAGCGKDEADTPKPVRTDGYLVEVTDRFYYENTEDYIDFISASTVKVESETLKKIGFSLVADGGIEELSRKVYSEQGNKGLSAHWRMERINFTYNSISATGEPIVLSGAIMLPNSTLPTVEHELDGVTLYNAYWVGTKDIIATDGAMIMIRASYNHLVVCSDFQGYGITEGKYNHPFLEYFTLARQSIDCELAALELIDRMGVRLKKGYGTYVMGMSKGAPVTMAVQKMLENSEPEEVRRRVNLEGTYCCSGPYDVKGLFFSINEGFAKGYLWLVPMLVLSTYCSHPDLFEGFTVEDFFTKSFFNAKTVIDGKEAGFPEAMNSQRMLERRVSTLCNELGFDEIRKILSPRFFSENGDINTEDRLVSIFLGILESNNPSIGWAPKSPVLMEASITDDMVGYEGSYRCYENLKYDERGIPDRYVGFNTYNGFNHDEMSIFGMVRMFVMKNPVESLL